VNSKHLQRTSADHLSERAQRVTITSRDQRNLNVDISFTYRLPQTSVALACFFHGVTQHSLSSEFEPVANGFIQNGFAWFALDMQGHGHSSQLGNKRHLHSPGHVTSFQNVCSDAIHFINAVTAFEQVRGLPFIVVGHSFGGAVCTYISTELQRLFGSRFCGMCLSAPAIQPSYLPGCTTSAVIELAASIHPSAVVMKWSADSQTADPLRGDRLTMSTVNSGVNGWLRLVPPVLSTVSAPFIITHGTHDNIHNLQGSVRLYVEACVPEHRKVLQILPCAPHNIFADPVHSYSCIRAWLKFAREMTGLV